jgi:nickel-dependent lactate racemase
MIYYEIGSEHTSLSDKEIREGLYTALDRIGRRRRVLAVPPDFTRFHSRAGDITAMAYDYYGEALTDVLPALGTHKPMTAGEIETMFPGVPENRFRVHDWRHDVVTAGRVPEEYVAQISGGKVHYDWPAQLNRLLWEGGHDLILSVGQVVPHEVIGMANYNKNLFVGTGGAEAIHKSHFLGAAWGMEQLMGKADNPVRMLLNYASRHFIPGLPVVYVHTVVARDHDGKLVVRGLYIGDTEEVFLKAAELSRQVNFSRLDQPLEKVVVYLDPSEYRSTWLGNKSIYRTRMALADGGSLLVLAPGVKEFGEDAEIDRLIRKYGYHGTPSTLDAVARHPELAHNLSAAAHLIHGSTEGRFSVTYAPGKLTKQEIESAGYHFEEVGPLLQKYNPESLKEGFNTLEDGETIYFISNPAIGLWSI